MSGRKIWVVAVLAVAASIATVTVTQADSSSSTEGTTLSPPVIPEPHFTDLPCPPEPASTPDLVGCNNMRLVATDKKIDKLNGVIFSELGEAHYLSVSKAQVLHKFLTSHRAWLAYREANCQNLWASSEEGSIFPVVVGECLVAINKQRIKELRAFQRFPEG
jgi:uncharacterized protein YecT (DUF1311 family)